MSTPRIAYFTMEIALDAAIPTYSGGLGVLAGDTIRSAADIGVPMVAVTLLHRRGYFRQQLDADGTQHAAPIEWPVAELLAEEPTRATITLEERTVHIRAWRYDARGVGGHVVPVYFLDTDLPENDEHDRHLSGSLYGGDNRYRLRQEAVLGIGGVRILEALGIDVARYHMNEGHAALLTLELLDRSARAEDRTAVTGEDIAAVREQCVFTTHTPVPAGHDEFSLEMTRDVLGPRPRGLDRDDEFLVDVVDRLFRKEGTGADLQQLRRAGASLNMTYLALNLSSYVNGVAKKHGEVSREMFAGYGIDAITNGIHAGTWATPSFAELFDAHIPGWREDNFSLRRAIQLPRDAVWAAHEGAKRDLIELVRESTGQAFDPEAFTIGFARRAATYKRADLLFADLERLRAIARKHPVQVVYAGKAHPADQPGQALIRRVFDAARVLGDDVRVAYVPNYGVEAGRIITGGADIWLNTPMPPNEASGTSGMKSALNGVPSLSILDGWWIEGHIEHVTGWSIGEDDQPRGAAEDAASLYDKLEQKILPMFYDARDDFIGVMRNAIALNGSFFNTQRMVQQYAARAYL